MTEDLGSLIALAESQAGAAQPWQHAELHLLEQELRGRLCRLGIGVTPDAAVLLLAAAELVCAHTPEWGGDARDAVGELALLGLRLLAGDSAL